MELAVVIIAVFTNLLMFFIVLNLLRQNHNLMAGYKPIIQPVVFKEVQKEQIKEPSEYVDTILGDKG